MDYVNFLEAVFNFASSIVDFIIAIVTLAVINDKMNKD